MNDWDPFLDRPRLEQLCVRGILVKPGDRVRLHPLGRADILDIALEGKSATIQAIEQDFEDRVYLGVVVDDDPGRDLGQLRQPGHCFYFGIEDVELVEPDRSPSEASCDQIANSSVPLTDARPSKPTN